MIYYPSNGSWKIYHQGFLLDGPIADEWLYLFETIDLSLTESLYTPVLLD